MITFLARKFILSRGDMSPADTRAAYGMLSGIVGICLNALLFLFKLLAAWLSGSVAIVADAINNLSDAGSSAMTLIGFHLSKKKPDIHHPFGHGRAEYVAGLLVSIVILLLGMETMKGAIEKIFSGEAAVLAPVSAIILAASVCVKLYMFLYNRALSRKLSSAALKATAMDSLGDAVATGVVLLAMLVMHFTGANIDGWAGIVVSLFILYSGFGAARDTIQPLLGQPSDPNLVNDIRRIAMEDKDVLGIHDLIVHDYGPGRRMVTLHAEVHATEELLALHESIDALEHRLKNMLGCDVVVHMDPVVTDDEKVAPAREQVIHAIHTRIDPALQLHDFRMNTSPKGMYVMFDMVVPYGFRMTDEELQRAVVALVSEIDPTWRAIVQIDHPV